VCTAYGREVVKKFFRKVVAIGSIIKYTLGFTYIYRGEVVDFAVTEMTLTKILQPTCVKVPLEGKDKNLEITELVDLLDANGLLLDKKVVSDAVFAREQTRSTGIGSGIAVPHGKCNGVKELVMAIGIVPEGVDFASVDGKAVTIVFLLVSPTDQTGPHIQALARISRLMLDEEFKQGLEKASSAEEVYELLSKSE